MYIYIYIYTRVAALCGSGNAHFPKEFAAGPRTMLHAYALGGVLHQSGHSAKGDVLPVVAALYDLHCDCSACGVA